MDILDTPRLNIRPFTAEDLHEAHKAILMDIRWLGRRDTLDECRLWLQRQEALTTWRATGGYYGDRAIILKATGAMIGLCGFRCWSCNQAERGLYDKGRTARESAGNKLELGVGYAIISTQRRQGYATEAVNALITYGFNGLHIHRIIALTGRGNDPSVHVMRSTGMAIGINPDPAADYPWAIGMIENPA